MNEAEDQNKPVEEEALVMDMSDFNDDDDVTSSEDTEQPNTEEVSTPAETKEEEVDYTPLISKLSKDIKYMDEEVEIGSYDDIVKNYQKGLDYDRKTKKLEELENSEDLVYIRSKAKESGLTPNEYIKALKDMETNQTKQQEADEFNEMIENGVAENIAKKVIDTNRIAKEIQQEKLRLKEDQDILRANEAKDNDNKMFLEKYPDVKIKDIPKEVYADAEKTNLITAYTEYQNKQLMKQLEEMKHNKTNEDTSPVTTTTEHGGVVVEKKDDFLTGLGF